MDTPDNRLMTRNGPEQEIQTRTMAVARAPEGGPATLDEETRSVEVIAATEQPVEVYDWTHGRIMEVLLMSGLRDLPDQVPLLDTHYRYSASDVQGSVRELRVQGDKLVGRAYFSTAEGAEETWIRVREGHLTDLSVGYRVEQAQYIDEGETAKIQGQTFEGPMRVVTGWRVQEISVCPIGADDAAKARARAGEPKPEKEDRMDKRLREILESRGLAKDATEAQAWKFLEKLELRSEEVPAQRSEPAPENPGQGLDEEAIRADAVRAEQARITEIRAMCTDLGYEDMADEMIRNNTTVGDARKAVLDKIRSRPTAEGVGHRTPRVEITADAGDKFRSAAQDGILVRAGLPVENPATGYDELRGMRLDYLAIECLRRSGQRIPGDPREMVGRALTTSDFPIILGNVANKSLFAGWDGAEETWTLWCDTGQVNDFKTHTSARASELDDLEEVPEEGEYIYGDQDEAKEQYQIVTYGKMYNFSRQAIINDDLGALTKTLIKMGEAAARKVGDLPYAVLTANAAMGDGVALFASGHSNLQSGSVLDVTNLGTAVKAMKLQKDIKGLRRLNIRPRYFLAPVALEGSAEDFFRPEMGHTQARPSGRHPYEGTYLTRIYDARLDDNDANAWYLAAEKGKTITVFFLNGIQKPFMETKEGWTRDGVEYKVRIDAGAKAMDFRGLQKNPGAS